MFNYLKKLFSQPEPVVVEAKPKKSRAPRKPKAEAPQPSAKELATQRGEPYIAILSVDVDPSNINAGGFTLDWNDKFVSNLIRAGYKQRDDDTDERIVDRWFGQVCRNIALEVYEQKAADPANRDDLRVVTRKDLGNGRSEIG